MKLSLWEYIILMTLVSIFFGMWLSYMDKVDRLK